MKKSKILLFSMVLVTFTGCSKITSWETSGIHVNKKGAVTEAIIESFDKDNYNEEELETSIDEMISAYNKEAGKDTIALKKFQVKDKKTKVILEYDSYIDYQEFNHLELYHGPLEKLDNENYDMTTKMIAVTDGKKNKKESKTLKQLKKEKAKYQVVVVKDLIQVEVDKKLAFVSENVDVVEGKIGRTTDNQTYGYLIYEG